MNNDLKQSLWKQFGASIDKLENAVQMCPAEVWSTETKFWYTAYHCLFYLDYYLSTDPANFIPPEPFTLSELDPSGAMSDRVYTKSELLAYINHSRKKCYDLIASLNDELAAKRWIDSYHNFSMFEILIYNMRHVQHHAAQLNLFLRQGMVEVPQWVSQTGEDPATGVI